MEGEIKFVGDLERLVVKAGDKFVLRVAHTMDEAEREAVFRALREFLGENAKVLVLDEGASLGIVSEASE